VSLLIAKQAAVTSAIRVRRVYKDPEPGDGSRIFTDRLSACAAPPNLHAFVAAPTTAVACTVTSAGRRLLDRLADDLAEPPSTQ
jgi:hypothetical protein